MDIVQETWKELNQEINCFGSRVLIRTEPIPEKIGSIYLPTKHTSFYGKIQGQYQWCTATVLAAGEESIVKSGEKIMFTRLAFANIYKMKDNTFVGWVEDANIECVIEEGTMEN